MHDVFRIINTVSAYVPVVLLYRWHLMVDLTVQLDLQNWRTKQIGTRQNNLDWFINFLHRLTQFCHRFFVTVFSVAMYRAKRF